MDTRQLGKATRCALIESHWECSINDAIPPKIRPCVASSSTRAVEESIASEWSMDFVSALEQLAAITTGELHIAQELMTTEVEQRVAEAGYGAREREELLVEDVEKIVNGLKEFRQMDVEEEGDADGEEVAEGESDSQHNTDAEDDFDGGDGDYEGQSSVSPDPQTQALNTRSTPDQPPVFSNKLSFSHNTRRRRHPAAAKRTANNANRKKIEKHWQCSISTVIPAAIRPRVPRVRSGQPLRNARKVRVGEPSVELLWQQWSSEYMRTMEKIATRTVGELHGARRLMRQVVTARHEHGAGPYALCVELLNSDLVKIVEYLDSVKGKGVQAARRVAGREEDNDDDEGVDEDEEDTLFVRQDEDAEDYEAIEEDAYREDGTVSQSHALATGGETMRLQDEDEDEAGSYRQSIDIGQRNQGRYNPDQHGINHHNAPTTTTMMPSSSTPTTALKTRATIAALRTTAMRSRLAAAKHLAAIAELEAEIARHKGRVAGYEGDAAEAEGRAYEMEERVWREEAEGRE